MLSWEFLAKGIGKLWKGEWKRQWRYKWRH